MTEKFYSKHNPTKLLTLEEIEPILRDYTENARKYKRTKAAQAKDLKMASEKKGWELSLASMKVATKEQPRMPHFGVDDFIL